MNNQTTGTAPAHNNNFDFLRFLGAAFIIISHTFALSLGYAQIYLDDPSLLLGQSGLAILLVISGYLICQSWERKPNLKIFFWKRALRIIPGLAISIAFVLLIIGPLVTSLSPAEYISSLFSLQTWEAIPFFKNGQPIGVFVDNPVTFVNAPLWAIPLECMLYVLLALLGVIGLLWKRQTLLTIIFLNVCLWVMWYENPVLNKIRFTLYFFIGAYLYINRDKLEYRWQIAAALILLLFISSMTGWLPALFLAAFISIPYLVLYAAHLPTPHLHNFGKYGDFSYGMFIFTYPVQQTIIYFSGGEISIPVMCAISLVLAVIMGALSWHFIESKCLRLKNIIV